MVVHTRGDPVGFLPRIREIVAEQDPLVPIADVRTMESIVHDATAQDRFTMTLMSVFAGTAVLMVALGVYGMIVFSVRERIRDMALRLTVGMSKARLTAMVVAEGVVPAVLGLGVGVVAAFGIGKATQSLLYQVEPHDPVTVFGVMTLIVGIALVASWVPAVRAASVNPGEVLQGD